MSERSYAPPLGINGPLGPVDPEAVGAFALALQMHEGRNLGVFRIKPIAAPGAGLGWSVTVPSGVTWILTSVYGILTTSAVAGTRVPMMQLTDTHDTYSRITSPGTLAPSAVSAFSWNRALGVGTGGNAAPQTSGGLWGFPLVQNTLVQVITTSIDVSDQWSSCCISYIEVRERTWNERAQYIEDLVAGRVTTDMPGLLLGL